MVRRHKDEVLRVLETQIEDPEEVRAISETADEVAAKWVKPLDVIQPSATNGLIYGLVQSGKTGVLAVSGALGADKGYRTVVILTSDIDPLYDQTLGRIQQAFPAVDVLAKSDLKDQGAFLHRLKSGVCVVVMTKNAKLLATLNENLKVGRVPSLTCLIIDDEADQASLNTKARKQDGSRSAINRLIAELRTYFVRSTYLQVTATPQALFLQPPGHEIRPKFTVLSHPGADYIGGEEFFGTQSQLVREFVLTDIQALVAGSQPKPGNGIPRSLVAALDRFMIGATYKRSVRADQNCAFLCHVSTRTSDHQHIVDLLRTYKTDLTNGIRGSSQGLLERLKVAYDDLSGTHSGVAGTRFEDLVSAVGWYSAGITVKMVNGETDEDVAVRSPYNLFVGGNKLGRGVTIKNLLVSYYGRNPKSPQADTVLQHARMYGYRRGDMGLLRLYLPTELHTVFRAIHLMEKGLRELIAESPDEEFRGVYLDSGLQPTRKNVIVPGAVGIYTGGTGYNPAQVIRDRSTAHATARIDKLVAPYASKTVSEIPITLLQDILSECMPDQQYAQRVWDTTAILGSVRECGNLLGHARGYLWLDRDRGLSGPRRETQGILDSAEYKLIPRDKPALCLLRVLGNSADTPAWWPEMRFPDGRYAFAFSI